MWKKFLESLKPKKTVIPRFEKSKISRYHLVFTGHVQGVGFRIEVYQMALKLELTGWVRNLSDGSVEAEIQGEKNKMDYLMEHMRKLPRAHVVEIKKAKQRLIEDEKAFKIK